MTKEQWGSRVAGLDDSDDVARLLHDFNIEFDSPTPGPATLARRLRALLAGDDTFAVLVGEPAVGVALVTTRPNVWYEGLVALLDELYVAPHSRGQGAGSVLIRLVLETCRRRGVDLVEINVDEGDIDAQRFYSRHGFSWSEPDSEEKAFYFHMELI
jgi:GNAT superfamily N-acetyltransferase